MPVISPRRSTSSTSGSLYIPQTTSGTYSSSLANKSTGSGSSALSSSSSSSTSGYSSTYRSNGYTKTPSSTYSSSSFYPGSYLPRSTYPSVSSRSSYSSSSSSSALTGGSSGLSSSYRASSYLSGGNNDTTTSSSRFGRDLDRKRSTDNTDCNQNTNNNNSHTKSQRSSSTSRNPRASSSSYPSSSLARLVATSALEIYEKYSPANYIPKCELSRSSSLSEGAASATAAATANAATTSSSPSSSKNNDNKITHSNSISRISNNSNNNYSRRYNSRQTNGTINENSSEAPASALACSSSSSTITDTYLSVPQHSSSNGGSSSAANKLLLHVSYDLPDDSNSLRDLKISCISPTTTTTTSTTTSSSSSQDTKDTAQLATKVRSTSSLRTTLPPLPPNPTRDWDRDSSRSSILSSRNLSDDYSSSSSRKLTPEQEGLCGLRNIGNTCFMNSVIQCLSHTSELTKFLKTQNGVRSSSSKDQQILSEFAKLIREMWTSNVNSVTPSELKRAFSSKHRMYSDYNQQDAQEFLRFFLDSLHSALNSGVKGDLLKIDESLSDNRKADITWEWYAKAENSVIRDLFVGQLKSTLKCTVCGNTSVTFDPVWDLSVPLPSSSRCKLEACLDLFIREEVLDGDEMPTCSKCQTRRKSTKSFTIQRFPKYLVIHLKRFSETRWSKMSNIVEFPTGERELNMGPYGSNSSTNVYYSLYAISNHMGSTAGGHYVALCKHPITKKWHEFNDNVVSSELTESHLVSSSAYILFYERA